MTIQAANEFIGRADQDYAIRKLARERFGDIVNVGNEHGFDFTRDEFDNAMRERKATGGNPGDAESSQTCQCEQDKPEPSTCQCAQEEPEPSTCQCAQEEPAEPSTCQCVPNQ